MVIFKERHGSKRVKSCWSCQGTWLVPCTPHHLTVVSPDILGSNSHVFVCLFFVVFFKLCESIEHLLLSLQIMFMSCPSDCCLHPTICSTGCLCMPLSAGIRGASVPFKLKLRTETVGMHSTRKCLLGSVVTLLCKSVFTLLDDLLLVTVAVFSFFFFLSFFSLFFVCFQDCIYVAGGEGGVTEVYIYKREWGEWGGGMSKNVCDVCGCKFS